MKRTIGGILVVTLVLATTPAWADETDKPAARTGPAAQGQFRLSVEHAVAAIVQAPMEPSSRVQPAAYVNTTATTSGRVRRSGQAGVAGGSGGGHAMALIITLVTTAAGIAGTAYMIKSMKKATDQAKE